ncbi:isochorismatase family protein [Microbispora sp. RL4-1S]|uniref:Isochorismatase family protein n=1 Tax=Microbispora oryzae TaxID=2806554 RepID=A0A940WKR6_9ACTN|nr:isochorismatase family protein [Microbispora oryzae]MBP2705112.1 isochorismatase family protein [Microbispora oryzae]
MMSTPYPWPWHGCLDPRRLAVLVVGCASPYEELPGSPPVALPVALPGSLPEIEAVRAARVAGRVAGAARKAGGLVVRVRVRPPLRPGPPLPPYAWGGGSPAFPLATIGREAAPQDTADAEVHAPGWDGFHGSPLDELLRAAGRDLLVLAGCCLELGVHSTMRSANDRGYECLLLADACAAADPSLAAGALSTIEMSGGIFGAVGSSADLLKELS